MSTRAVTIWLVAALVLGAAVILVLRSPGGSAREDIVRRGDSVVSFDQAAVKSIEVTTPDGRRDTVTRSIGETEEWLLTTGSASPGGSAASEPRPTWPLAPAQARSIIRLLSGIRAEAEPDAAATVADPATVVRIDLTDGSARELRFSDRTLGGTVLVAARTIPASGSGQAEESRLAMVGSNLLNSLRNPGPRGWRDTSALPGMGPEASRITLKDDRRTIALARLGNQWHLREPVSAPANPEKVAAVIAALSRTTITDFLDDRTPEASLTGLDTPRMVVTVERDRPAPTGVAKDAGPTPAARTEMALGGSPADSSGTRLFASIKSGDGPARIVAVDVAQLSQVLTADPIAYIAQQATQSVPADVGAVLLSAAEPAPGAPAAPAASDKRLQRSLSAWAEVGPDGQEAMLAEADTSGINEFLATLSAKPAQSVVITAPADFKPAGYISLLKLDNAPLDVIGIGTVGATAVVFRTGDVYRSYPADGMPRVVRAWLAQRGGLTAPVPPPTEAAANPDMMK